MNITVDTQSDCNATLRAEIPADQVKSERKSIVKAFGAQAKIPGFRPGKIPQSMIEKRFAKDISAELEQRLISSACDQALKDNEDLKVLNFKKPESADHQDDGSFNFVMDLMLAPTFELPEYKGIKIVAAKPEPTEEEVQLEIDGLLQRYAEYTDIEDRALQENDICVMDFTTTMDGEPLDATAGILAGKDDYWIQLKDDAFLPGFPEQLIGAKLDETLEVKSTIDDSFPIEKFHNKELTFSVKIKKIKEQDLPEFDDKFVSETLQLGEDKTVSDLKELMSAQITQQKEQQINEDKVNQIIENLLGKVDFNLPEELVAAEAKNSVQQMVANAAQQGLTEEQVAAQQGDIEDAAQKQAKNNIKTNFIMQEIAVTEKLVVSDEEVVQRIAAMAQQQNKDPKTLIKEFQRDNRIPSLRNSMVIGKAIDFLLENAEIEEVEAKEEA